MLWMYLIVRFLLPDAVDVPHRSLLAAVGNPADIILFPSARSFSELFARPR